MHNSMPTKLHS